MEPEMPFTEHELAQRAEIARIEKTLRSLRDDQNEAWRYARQLYKYLCAAFDKMDRQDSKIEKLNRRSTNRMLVILIAIAIVTIVNLLFRR